MSVSIRPQFQEKRVGLTLAEPVLVTLTTPERLVAAAVQMFRRPSDLALATRRSATPARQL